MYEGLKIEQKSFEVSKITGIYYAEK